MIAVTSRPAHRPQRTCVGCRAVAPQSILVRIARVRGRIAVDRRRRAPGRGAYIHSDPACVAAAARGGLARTLRSSVTRAELDDLHREIVQPRVPDVGGGLGPSQTPADAVESVPRPVESRPFPGPRIPESPNPTICDE